MLQRRIWIALALATLAVFGRGAVAYANANACWNPAFNDPTTVDVSDISNLVTKTLLYSNPMDEVRRSLLVLAPTDLAPAGSDLAIDNAYPRADRPRAPPSA